MKIEVNAKIILTILQPTTKEKPKDFVLEVEQYLNSLPPLMMRTFAATRVGIRVHVDGKIPKVTQ